MALEMLVKPAADTAKRQIDEEKRPKDRAGEAEDGVEEEAEFEGTAGLGQIVAAEDQPQPHRDIQHVYPEKDAARRSAIIALPGERRQRALMDDGIGGRSNFLPGFFDVLQVVDVDFARIAEVVGDVEAVVARPFVRHDFPVCDAFHLRPAQADGVAKGCVEMQAVAVYRRLLVRAIGKAAAVMADQGAQDDAEKDGAHGETEQIRQGVVHLRHTDIVADIRGQDGDQRQQEQQHETVVIAAVVVAHLAALLVPDMGRDVARGRVRRAAAVQESLRDGGDGVVSVAVVFETHIAVAQIRAVARDDVQRAVLHGNAVEFRPAPLMADALRAVIESQPLRVADKTGSILAAIVPITAVIAPEAASPNREPERQPQPEMSKQAGEERADAAVKNKNGDEEADEQPAGAELPVNDLPGTPAPAFAAQVVKIGRKMGHGRLLLPVKGRHYPA